MSANESSHVTIDMWLFPENGHESRWKKVDWYSNAFVQTKCIWPFLVLESAPHEGRANTLLETK